MRVSLGYSNGQVVVMRRHQLPLASRYESPLLSNNYFSKKMKNKKIIHQTWLQPLLTSHLVLKKKNFLFQGEKCGHGLKRRYGGQCSLCFVRAVIAIDVGFPIGFPKTEGFRVCGPHTVHSFYCRTCNRSYCEAFWTSSCLMADSHQVLCRRGHSQEATNGIGRLKYNHFGWCLLQCIILVQKQTYTVYRLLYICQMSFMFMFPGFAIWF